MNINLQEAIELLEIFEMPEVASSKSESFVMKAIKNKIMEEFPGLSKLATKNQQPPAVSLKGTAKVNVTRFKPHRP